MHQYAPHADTLIPTAHAIADVMRNSPIPKTKNRTRRFYFMYIAGEQGFEPQLKASKASVLPLDDSPKSTTADRLQLPGINFHFIYLKPRA